VRVNVRKDGLTEMTAPVAHATGAVFVAGASHFRLRRKHQQLRVLRRDRAHFGGEATNLCGPAGSALALNPVMEWSRTDRSVVKQTRKSAGGSRHGAGNIEGVVVAARSC